MAGQKPASNASRTLHGSSYSRHSAMGEAGNTSRQHHDGWAYSSSTTAASTRTSENFESSSNSGQRNPGLSSSSQEPRTSNANGAQSYGMDQFLNQGPSEDPWSFEAAYAKAAAIGELEPRSKM